MRGSYPLQREPEALAMQSMRISRDDIAFVACSLQRFGILPDDIDDVTQEVLHAAFRSPYKYDSRRGKRQTWLFKIAFYQSQNHLHRAYHHREVLVPPTYFEQSPVDNTLNAELLMIRHEAERIVRTLLSTINANARAVFVAFEIEGVAMRDIVNRLGIPLSTAWSRLSRARVEFLRALHQWQQRQAHLMQRRRLAPR
jgi:RNA polymerase sigma factor (sigma-70 family)